MGETVTGAIRRWGEWVIRSIRIRTCEFTKMR
jgi:hypothetical protein